MDSEFLKKLKSISGTKEKINTLNAMMSEDENIARFFNMALNPYKNYGIKVLPEYSPSGVCLADGMLFGLCEDLSKMNHSNESVKLVAGILSNSNCPDIWGKLILKNPDCGINVSNFNKALPKNLKAKYEIKDYPCMLVASDFEKFNKKYADAYGQCKIVVQQKMDGARVNIIVNRDNSVKFYGRSGKEMAITNEKIISEFVALKNQIGTAISDAWVFDGELLVFENGQELDRKTGNGIINKVIRGTAAVEEVDKLHFILWDAIPKYEVFSDGGEFDPLKYGSRLHLLRQAISAEYVNFNLNHIDLVHTWYVPDQEGVKHYFREMLKDGNEGVIVKHLDNVWSNKRVTDMCKLKEIKDCDLKIVGWEEGTGKNKGKLGALNCESSDGFLVVSVGTGFSDEDREMITPEVIGKIVTVEYNMKIEDKNKKGIYSLFLPRFIEIRSDKDVANSNKEIM